MKHYCLLFKSNYHSAAFFPARLALVAAAIFLVFAETFLAFGLVLVRSLSLAFFAGLAGLPDLSIFTDFKVGQQPPAAGCVLPGGGGMFILLPLLPCTNSSLPLTLLLLLRVLLATAYCNFLFLRSIFGVFYF